jgi:hypothetical protein
MALLTPAAAGRRDDVTECRDVRLSRRLSAFVAALWTWVNVASGGSRMVWLLVPGMLGVLGPVPAFAQAPKAPEYSLKAAYLLNFTQFVEWPSNVFASVDAPIVIGVLGEDPFGSALDQAVREKKVHGRSLEIRRSKQISDLRGCHVLFVCASEVKRLSEILAAARRSGILTVSDIDRFVEQGGVISFVTENNKVRFEINMNAAAAAELRISAQLLRLAKKVWPVSDEQK